MPWKRSDVLFLKELLPTLSEDLIPWLRQCVKGYSKPEITIQQLQAEYSELLSLFPLESLEGGVEGDASSLAVFNLFAFTLKWLPILEKEGLFIQGLSPGLVLKDIVLKGAASIRSEHLLDALRQLLKLPAQVSYFSRLPASYMRTLPALETLSESLQEWPNAYAIRVLDRALVPRTFYEGSELNTKNLAAIPSFYRYLLVGKCAGLGLRHMDIAHLCVALFDANNSEAWWQALHGILKEEDPQSSLKILTLSLVQQLGNLKFSTLDLARFYSAENPFNFHLFQHSPLLRKWVPGDNPKKIITVAVAMVLHQVIGLSHIRRLGWSYRDQATAFEEALDLMPPWFQSDPRLSERYFFLNLGEPTPEKKAAELMAVKLPARSDTPPSVTCSYDALSAAASSVDPTVTGSP